MDGDLHPWPLNWSTFTPHISLFFSFPCTSLPFHQAINLAMLSSMDRDDLQRLIKKELYPSWVQFHEFERVGRCVRECER